MCDANPDCRVLPLNTAVVHQQQQQQQFVIAARNPHMVKERTERTYGQQQQVLLLLISRWRPVVEEARVCGGEDSSVGSCCGRQPTFGAGTRQLYSSAPSPHAPHIQPHTSIPSTSERCECCISRSGRCAYRRKVCLTSDSVLRIVQLLRLRRQ